jgi:hypothetical protein
LSQNEQEAGELDAWLAKASPPRFEVGAPVRIREWSRDGPTWGSMVWLGRTGTLVGRVDCLGAWYVWRDGVTDPASYPDLVAEAMLEVIP